MKLLKDINSIQIHARRWFQRSYGNTYFTADISVNGQTVGHLPFQYGYGNHFEDMAAEWLEDNGYIERDHHDNGSSSPLWQLRDTCGINYEAHATDVERKRDL